MNKIQNHVCDSLILIGFKFLPMCGSLCWACLCEWIKQLWDIYTMEYYLAVKKEKNLPFATAWMALENIMQSEISQSEKDKYHMISLICGI